MSVRVRFAPSPTGPLHIGGVRTALYNYLFAQKHQGTFILRVEDTDQNRYVPGAEAYIIDSLRWLGIMPAEGPGIGGDHGPYRQSERKELYWSYAIELVNKGYAYYAFDSAETLEAARKDESGADTNFKYGVHTRMGMSNSLTLSAEEVQSRIDRGDDYVIRLRFPENETIHFQDEVRGDVKFDTNELDDKVIMKSDGMPTYHLANIVDDHLMEITHVIRGEEWLSSTAHHVFMYTCFGWQAPSFSHLPLLLKPTGKGKLSKRDGAQFGFPVFPMDWHDQQSGEYFPGFREQGFLPAALLNFLALLGWSSGTDQEIFTLQEMAEAFELQKIVKSGARFDFEKAKWFNQQYIIHQDNASLAAELLPMAQSKYPATTIDYLTTVCGMMKERVDRIPQILTEASYLFELPRSIDQDTLSKKYRPELFPHFVQMVDHILPALTWQRAEIETAIKAYIAEHQLKMGEILPIFRIALTGTMKGPDLMDTILLLGQQEVSNRVHLLLKA